MFCSKCGAQLMDDVMFCPKCGNKVSVEAADPVGGETIVAGTDVPKTEPRAACSEKSRRTYQWLALFLGALGIHNFYVGRIKFAIAQLCLTVVQAAVCEIRGKNFFALVAIWAFVEIFTVKKDGKGLPFATKSCEKSEKNGNAKKNFGGCLTIFALILVVGSCLSYLGSDDKDDLAQSAKEAQSGDGIPYCKDVSLDYLACVCLGTTTPEKDVLYPVGAGLKVFQVIKREEGLTYCLCDLVRLPSVRNILLITSDVYADGDVIRDYDAGYCLCKGTWTYETSLGGSKTVYVFLMIKDKALAEKMIKDVENRKKEQRRLDEISRKMKDGADDGTAMRIAEICGLKFGATPLEGVAQGKYGSQTIDIDGAHKLPPFAKAELSYTKKNRLHTIQLRSLPSPKRTVDEQKRLMRETKEMMERKLGIVLNEGVENLYGVKGYFGTVSKDGVVVNEFQLLSTVPEHEICFSVKDREVAAKDNY